MRVVALGVRPGAAAAALAAGADAFVCKGDPPRRLIEALEELARARWTVALAPPSLT